MICWAASVCTCVCEDVRYYFLAIPPHPSVDICVCMRACSLIHVTLLACFSVQTETSCWLSITHTKCTALQQLCRHGSETAVKKEQGVSSVCLHVHARAKHKLTHAPPTLLRLSGSAEKDEKIGPYSRQDEEGCVLHAHPRVPPAHRCALNPAPRPLTSALHPGLSEIEGEIIKAAEALQMMDTKTAKARMRWI